MPSAAELRPSGRKHYKVADSDMHMCDPIQLVCACKLYYNMICENLHLLVCMCPQLFLATKQQGVMGHNCLLAPRRKCLHARL